MTVRIREDLAVMAATLQPWGQQSGHMQPIDPGRAFFRWRKHFFQRLDAAAEHHQEDGENEFQGSEFRIEGLMDEKKPVV
jgi:hypothetical protein